jgi:hypothetical protein
MKLRHIFMAVSLVISAGLVLFGDTNSSNQLVEPVGRATATNPMPNQPILSASTTIHNDTRRSVQNKNNQHAPDILMLLPRAAIVHEAADDKDTFVNKDSTLFSNQNWLPPAPPPPKPLPPPPPSAPAMPFTYLGKKWEEGVWEVYLARGNDISIVRNHSLIDANYRVESILPPTLTMTYLPLQQTQKITIGAAE